MFKKLKDKLEEEFKQGPLKFPVSVQQLAQVISPSPSLNSLSENNAGSSATCTSDPSSVSANFFSIGDDDDSQEGSIKTLPLQSIDLTPSSPSNMTQSRSRRSSLSSVTSDASSLFPIFENPSGQIHFQSDLESEMEDGMASQIEKISKEQLYQSYKKVFNRYNKYKGRYVDLQRHYKDLLHDNIKTKNVLQESQDKSLRRIAELKEQCQLEQNAKAHLEEALRNDVEDRDHIITTLKTKISLLRSGNGSDGLLLDIHDRDETNITEIKTDELEKIKQENENLQKEISSLKKIKDTACHLIHRCDTTIEEATEDVSSETLKRKMSELKSEIQKMKSENESLSNLLSKNIITDEDKKSQSSMDGSLLIDFSGMDSSHVEARTDEKDEKDKKIEKLNNLLLKCKEKISSLNSDIKSKTLLIEDKSKRLKELTEELETNKKLVSQLTADMEGLKLKEEENALFVAENKMAIHKELESKEEQIRALTKELKTSENEFKKEKQEIVEKYEKKLREMSESFSRDVKSMKEENEKLGEELKSKMEDVKNENLLEKTKEWEMELKKTLESVFSDGSYQRFIESKSAEFERASCRLEERISVVQKKMVDILQRKEKELQSCRDKIKEVTESKYSEIDVIKDNVDAEYKGHLEKLNSEIRDLSQKVEELESALAASEKKSEGIVEEKTAILKEKDKTLTKLKDRMSSLEVENERMRENCVITAAENKRLGDELYDQREKLRSAEGDNRLIEKINKEKTEAEKKLQEYIDNYKKLEEENRLLESDLNEKCEKLLRDLSESKEKIKFLEGENAMKNNEVERLKSELSQTAGKNESLKTEISEIKKSMKQADHGREEISKENKVLSGKIENAVTELDSLRREHLALQKDKSEVDRENEKLKNDVKNLEAELEIATSENAKMGSDLDQRLNGLETIKNKLSSELKNLEEKLEDESKISKNLKEELQKELDGNNRLEREIVELKSKCEKLEEDVQKSSKEAEGLLEENENLKKELSGKIEELTVLNREKSDLVLENEKLKLESAESEKARCETGEKMEVLLNERNEMSDSLQVKVNELEALKVSLNSTREEFSVKIKALEEEKERLLSENENKLNILKNEIKFMNNKFEEDIGNMEENRSMEMKELNSRVVVAEKTSQELLEKLEKITTERDEGNAAVEERDMKIAELEACIETLKAEMNEKFNQNMSAKESGDIIGEHETDIAEKQREIDSLRAQNEEYGEIIKSLKSANEKLKGLGSEEGAVKGINETLETSDTKTSVPVEEVVEKEIVTLSNAEKDLRTIPEIESGSIESFQKKVIQQAAEIRELQKQHKREVTELRKIISMKRKSRINSAESPDWGGTLDNDTEHEYLRNILYEYMMGREQLVLAKVLSAIVKFDKQQTRNVLEKEQHRQTLVNLNRSVIWEYCNGSLASRSRKLLIEAGGPKRLSSARCEKDGGNIDVREIAAPATEKELGAVKRELTEEGKRTNVMVRYWNSYHRLL